jgi:hypothetical protein
MVFSGENRGPGILILRFAGSAAVSPAKCRQRRHYRPYESQKLPFYNFAKAKRHSFLYADGTPAPLGTPHALQQISSKSGLLCFSVTRSGSSILMEEYKKSNLSEGPEGRVL